jgi:hypothetical protein
MKIIHEKENKFSFVGLVAADKTKLQEMPKVSNYINVQNLFNYSMYLLVEKCKIE